MAEKKEKRYVSDNAQLMAEWNWGKNNELGLFPDALMCGSGKKVWWKCSKGHEWQAIVKNRTNGRECPYCSGKKVLIGYNDLQTIAPALATEWNYEKNDDLKPEHFTANSGQKVWWKCSKGHEWQATIANRNRGSGCPYCSGRNAIKGENDLQTVNPALANEWNYERNKGVTPLEVMPSSGQKVWWKCSKGHEWQATINSRNDGIGCPVCNSERQTSFPEYALVYYLKRYGIEVIHLYKEKGYELDVYIPSKKIAIEYDGHHWHENKTEKDLEKNKKCERDGIKLYRIREELPPLNDSSIDYIVQRNEKALSKILEEILSEIIGINIDVDIQRDALTIETFREYTEKESSILYSNPDLAKEWNYGKNGNLKPEHFAANSNKKVWWKCKKGHEWQAIINSRNKGNGCPYCSNRKVLEGYNDLRTFNPTLAAEWNYEKNGNFIPESFTSKSNKKVWWKCNRGHEWQATISDRNSGKGCPYCSGRYVIKGENDLITVNPTLAREWNYEKNNELTPMDISPNSSKKVWWKCSKGHEWQATIANRNKGSGCPYCSGRNAVIGYNDLQTVNPILAKEWNYRKNGNLRPESFTANSGQKVWWKCSKGHEWQATIDSRNRGSGCPYCTGNKVLKGYNDLQTVNPILAEEWNYKKNGNLRPEHYTANSGEKVWWKCKKGHEWQATVKSRNKGTGCPYCSSNRTLQGYNDLQTINPTLADEWNYEKNDDIKPENFTANSHKKVWWKCNKGHEWQATIASRNSGRGCPICAKEKRNINL